MTKRDAPAKLAAIWRERLNLPRMLPDEAVLDYVEQRARRVMGLGR